MNLKRILTITLALALILILASSPVAMAAPADDLVITGVIDGPLSGGVPKAVELFVKNDIPDLSLYGLGSANNGGGSDGIEFTFPADEVTAGTCIWIATEATGFESFFGFSPTYTHGTAVSINGDDAIELFTYDSVSNVYSVSDVFGDINIDGSGQPWEYLDGWAYRNSGTGPDGASFMLGSWSFSGPNALDDETSNTSVATPLPIGTYGNCPIPDSAPSVSSTTPANNESGVGLDANISISFSEDVNLSGNWFEISCATSGVHSAAVSGGPQIYTLDPDADFVNGESCTVTIFATQVEDVDTEDPPGNMDSDFVFSFDTDTGTTGGVPDIVINEIHADPDSIAGDANGDGVAQFSDDEFVELVNNSGSSADISGWTLSDGFGVRHIFPTGTVVPDQCSIVVFGGGLPAGTFGGAFIQTASSGALGFNNGGDDVTLNDGIIDQAAVSYGGEGGDNQSLTRDPDITGSDNPFTKHSLATGSGGALFSPGTQIDGRPFPGCVPILLLSEIIVTPTEGEFVEIHNPGATAVDLSDVYLTDATFAGGGTYYYNIVTGSNAGGGGFNDFHARFPHGASIDGGEYQTIAIAGSDDFMAKYGTMPTYELYEDGTSADTIPDMREAFPNSIDKDSSPSGLSNSGEVVILYYWDGETDLVTDLDYAVWGDKAEAVDKSGVSKDGPDPDSDTSTYLPDTPIANQDVLAAGSHSSDQSWQRDIASEGDELHFGGNGAAGHDETSENLSDTWCEAPPTPGAGYDCPEFVAIPLAIYEIQGPGTTSPYVGQYAVTSGIVVADFQGSDELNGFFIQDVAGDGDTATADGIFVYDPNGTDVVVGDVVEVTGQVSEYFDLTEINNVASIVIQSTGTLPAPAPVTLPETVNGDLEQVEGMLVQITDTSDMYVAQNYFLGRYGQMTLASGGRLFQPTNQFEPGSVDVSNLADENARKLLILDDGQDISGCGDNPVPVPYIGAAPPAVIRGGDQISNLIGVLDYGRINSGGPCSDNATFARDYRLHPTQAPVFTEANSRAAAPDAVGGSLKVVSFNVLNFFNGDGMGGGFPTSRGADSYNEFVRQRIKIFEALKAIDGDVVGLMEIENDGFDEYSAIAELVKVMNEGPCYDTTLCTDMGYVGTGLGEGTYAYITAGPGSVGTDEITVGFIYKPASVTPVGSPIVFDDPDFTNPNNLDGQQSRPAIAQTFQAKSDGALFTPIVNHLKSKGSSCGVGDDDPEQGNCNVTRTLGAEYLVNTAVPAVQLTSGDLDVAIIGDLNAYAMEDPIRALTDGGLTNLVNAFVGDDAYSYTFDGLVGYLDHSLSTANLFEQVTETTIWHINTDEPAVIDYDEDFNPLGYYSPDVYRASDHDPVIVGLDLNGPPVCTDAYPSEASLKPPNHKFVSIEVLGVTDPEGDTLAITIDSIFQDEAVDAPESGNTAPDGMGVGTSAATVRAERVGDGGNGRVYHIFFTADDGNNNSCSGEVLVSVPLDEDTPVVDDGALFDSTVAP